MKKQIILPLVLVIAAIIVGTVVVGMQSTSTDTSVITVDNTTPVTTDNGQATITAVSVSSSNSAAAGLSGDRVIKWETSSYPSGGTVTINLIKKISDQPVAYSLVRTIAQNTQNDGQEIWTPGADEVGADIFVEVVCPSNLSVGCRVGSQPAPVI